MIAENVATRQVLRLSGLVGFSAMTEEGQRELVAALSRAARDPAHAGRTVSKWLDQSRFVPTPVDIREIAARTDYEQNPGTWRCAHCGGTGWQEIYEFHTWRDGKRKDTERVSRDRFEYLQALMETHYHNPYGVVGEQVVNRAVIRCVGCKLGRIRAEAEAEEKSA